jgi:ATP:ADP antiporter, AAA family
MTDSMELKDVFYACVVPFLIFFSLFALVIYPNRAFIHPHGLVDMLASTSPANFAAPLSIIRNWSFAVFYVMAEMWGSVVASLLFWGFANEVTTVDEAKKYCKSMICVCSKQKKLLDLVRKTYLVIFVPYFILQIPCLV